jgi:hypothetical protein
MAMDAILATIVDGGRGIVLIYREACRNKLFSPSNCNLILNHLKTTLPNPFRGGAQGWDTLDQQCHAAGGGNGSIMVRIFVSCVLASKKSSEREFFVPAGTDLALKLLKYWLVYCGFGHFGFPAVGLDVGFLVVGLGVVLNFIGLYVVNILVTGDLVVGESGVGELFMGKSLLGELIVIVRESVVGASLESLVVIGRLSAFPAYMSAFIFM